MNIQKKNIINWILKGNTDGLLEYTKKYEEDYPYDMDIRMFQGYLLIIDGNYDLAIRKLEEEKEKNPFDADIYYLIATAYSKMGKTFEALDYFDKAILIQKVLGQEFMFFNEEECLIHVNDAINKIHLLMDGRGCLPDKNIKDKIDYLAFLTEYDYWFPVDIIRCGKSVIGNILWNSENDKLFCGFYRGTDGYLFSKIENKSLILFKGEILHIDSCDHCTYKNDFSEKVLLPIATLQQDEVTMQFETGTTYQVRHTAANHFNYYPVCGKVFLKANSNLIVGKPVVLGHSYKRKKLVMTLFVDGLSQYIIDKIGLDKLMPNTYEFFSKGIRFNNAFTTSDWTYPSLASYITGLEIPDHMMIKPDLTVGIPKYATPFFKNMKEAGYYTTMISGDWRACLSDGYCRDIDCNIVQHLNVGMHAEMAVADAIEHMEAFSDTDQYIWLGTGELHDVADDFELPVSVQTHLDLMDFQCENKCETSVRQNYSEIKQDKYIAYAKQVDRNLGPLYEYIEKHFNDDEFVVTIFGDHGQTYFTKPGMPHLSRTHSNVGFMVRGGGFTGVSSEYVSALDYPSIICSLANITYDNERSSGMLPKSLGGKVSHDFVVTETIHQGDPYMAAIRNAYHTFYLKTENLFDINGRIEWGNYETSIENADGEIIWDDEITKKYVDWIKNHLKYLMYY